MVTKQGKSNGQETADIIRREIEDIESRIRWAKDEKGKPLPGCHLSSVAAMIDYIPSGQRKYSGSINYDLLILSYMKFIESNFVQEKKQEFIHAKENFDSYCEMMENMEIYHE
jgi:hypothetical protein